MKRKHQIKKSLNLTHETIITNKHRKIPFSGTWKFLVNIGTMLCSQESNQSLYSLHTENDC